jgi:hypothetical protein
MFCTVVGRRGLPITYLIHIRTQWFFTENIQALPNRCNGLRCMNIRAGADPHRLKSRVLNHLVVGIVDLDSPVVVFASSPFKLRLLGAADSNYLSSRDTVEKCSNMSFSHAPEAGHSD